jgi:hypothetical protein
VAGTLRCIFCKERLSVSEYPFVGTILQCLDCNELMLVQGHYLGYNQSVNMAVSKLPQELFEKLKKKLRWGGMDRV